MASITLTLMPKFPEGTSVDCFPRTAWGVESLSGTPSGVAVDTQTVTSGAVTFTGLSYATPYVATATVSGTRRFVNFYVTDTTTGASTDGRRRAALPTGVLSESFEWLNGNHSLDDLANTNWTSGRLQIHGGGFLQAGDEVAQVKFMAGATAGASLTHSWVALLNAQTSAVLALSADVTTAAWGANTFRTFTVSYAATDDTPIAVGLVIAGTTLPSLRGKQASSGTAATTRSGPPYASAFSADTGLTTPVLASVGAQTVASAQAYYQIISA